MSAHAGEARERGSRLFVVTDQNVAAAWLDTVVGLLRTSGCSHDVLLLTPGETSKCVDGLERCWDWLAESGCRRRDVVMALGGGVVGDLAGFGRGPDEAAGSELDQVQAVGEPFPQRRRFAGGGGLEELAEEDPAARPGGAEREAERGRGLALAVARVDLEAAGHPGTRFGRGYPTSRLNRAARSRWSAASVTVQPVAARAVYWRARIGPITWRE